MNERILVEATPDGVVYRRQGDEQGDHKRLATMDYGTLLVTLEDDCPEELRDAIFKDAYRFFDMRRQNRGPYEYPIDGSDKTVMVATKFDDNKHTANLWRAHEVKDVATVEEFLAKYYKHDRYRGRGEEYATGLLASHQEDWEKDGFDIISHYDSKTGEYVAFFGDSKPDA